MVLGRRILSFLVYQATWYVCVQGAGKGRMALGLGLVAALLALNLATASDRRAVLLLALIAGGMGLAVDSGLGLAGVFNFSLAPVWIVALWMAFGSVLPAFLSWLGGRYVLASLIGAVGAPLSYYGGVGLGAVQMPHLIFSLTAIALVWAAVMPLLVRITERVHRPVSL